MELRLEAAGPGGVSELCVGAETSVGANGNFVITNIWAEGFVSLDRDACAGGMFVSEECALQQEGFATAIDGPQSCVICWQQAWC